MKFPISMTLGAIAGVIFSITWFLMAKSMGFYSINVYIYRNIITFGLIVLGVFLSVFLVKRQNLGFIEFKEALKNGMWYCIVFGVIVAIFNHIYYKYITPDTIDYFLSEAKKAMLEDTKLKPEDYPKYMDSVRENYGSLRLIPPILFWGLIISLLSGAILQKKNPHSFSAN
jgi:hypothetical protein